MSSGHHPIRSTARHHQSKGTMPESKPRFTSARQKRKSKRAKEQSESARAASPMGLARPRLIGVALRLGPWPDTWPWARHMALGPKGCKSKTEFTRTGKRGAAVKPSLPPQGKMQKERGASGCPPPERGASSRPRTHPRTGTGGGLQPPEAKRTKKPETGTTGATVWWSTGLTHARLTRLRQSTG
jgi:hypothetical protein